MANASLILQTLDRHLDHPVRLILYGRAALQLGFVPPQVGAAHSKDVDCIIPMADVEPLTADSGFWEAQALTNEELRPLGLYITHLFPASEVFLRRDWEQHLVPIARGSLQQLRLFRPAALDLVLTKMMRGDDPQDMTDAGFLIRHDRITEMQLQEAFAQMKPIALVELRDAFERARPLVLKLARAASS
jgi:hypothetical protein